jgi:CHAT domain-containing protein/predicted negative regulator of RcsB-dependent stress response
MLNSKCIRKLPLAALLLSLSQYAVPQQSSNGQSLIDSAKLLAQSGTKDEILQLLPDLHTAANASTDLDQHMWLLMEAGLLERKLQNYRDALTDFQTAAALVQQSSAADYGVLIGDVAAVYSDLNDYPHALSSLESVLSVTNDWNLKLILNIDKGFILGQQGHNQEAIGALNAALAAVPAGQINYRETDLQRTLCERYEALSKYDTALQHCQLALQSVHGTVNSDYVTTQISDAEVKDAKGDAAGYQTELQSALTNATTLHDDTLILRAQVDLATVFDRNRDYDKALQSLDSALSSPVLSDDARAVALTNRSMVLLHLGRIDEAKQSATDATTAFKTMGQPSVTAMINLAAVLVKTHSASEAIALLEGIKPSLGNDPNTQEWVSVHDNLGAAYIEAGNASKAYDEFSAEKSAAGSLGDSRKLAAAEGGLSVASYTLGHNDEARLHALAAVSLLQQSPDAFLEITAREVLALTLADPAARLIAITTLEQETEQAHMQGDSIQALFILADLSRQLNAQTDGLQYAAKAFAMAKATGDEEFQALALDVIGSIDADQGKFDDSESKFDEAITHVEKWRGGIGADIFRASFDNFILRPFQDALSGAERTQHYQRAFEIEEEMKAKILVERLHRKAATVAPVNGGFAYQEVKLRSQLDNLETVRNTLAHQPASADTTQKISDITTQLATQRAEYDQLIQQISLSEPLRAVTLDTGRPTLTALQQTIPTDATVVEYAFVDDQVMIFVVSRTTFDCKVVALKQSDLQSQLRSLRGLGFSDLNNRPSVLSDMYSELIAPVRGLIHTNQIIVVPDGIIRDVPFSALYDGARYLSDFFLIANIPTAKILRSNSKTLAQANTRYLLASYANPLGLALLTQADDEVKDIASIFGTTAVTNETRRNFLASAVDANIIHVAAHAEPVQDQPDLSRLYLRPDGGQQDTGAMTVFDIAGLTLSNTRLVVLSACNSNVSAVNRLDEAVGFPESFLEAGVPTTISSLWLVDDDSARELMKSFYLALQSGKRVDEALAEAQAQARTSNQHPYYWAGFIVVGDGGKVF